MRFCCAFGAFAVTAAVVCSVACKHKEAEPAPPVGHGKTKCEPGERKSRK